MMAIHRTQTNMKVINISSPQIDFFPSIQNERVDQDLTGWVDPGPDKTFQAQNQGGLTLQVGSPIT